MSDFWQIYKDTRGEWRWRRVSPRNGKIVGASSEGYKKRAECISNALRHGAKADDVERPPFKL